MKSISGVILYLLLPLIGIGQTELPVSLAYGNHQTAKPFQHFDRFGKAPIHSGFTIGTAFSLNKDSTHQLLQTGKLGYFYHLDHQAAIQLYSEFTYRLNLHDHWQPFARIGAGYLHAFPDTEGFALQSDGTYKENKGWGRPQVMFTGSLGIQYKFRFLDEPDLRLFLEYQPWFQYPFVNDYVPVLPYTAFQVGMMVPVRWN